MAVSVNEKRGTVIFDGEPTLFYMAVCGDCDMRLPFGCAPERGDWIRGHRETGHEVTLALEVRP